MIARLREALRAAGYDPEPEELADIIWLATQELPLRTAPTEPADGNAHPGSSRNSPHDRRIQHTQPFEVSLPPSTHRKRALYSTAEGPGASGPAVTHLRIGTPKALPYLRSLERSLRPLRTTVRSRVRHELDLAGTISAIADGFPDVALRPARELLLDVTLVVDDGLSMAIWHDAAHELYQALHRLRAFGRTRLLGMNTDRSDAIRLTAEPFRPGAPRTAMEGGERHLVLVLTDAVSEAWSTGAAQRMLNVWGRRGPLAVLQVLPEHMWQETGLPTTRLMVSAARPGTSNRNLKLRHPRIPSGLLPVPGMAIPVIDAVSGSSATAWARLVGTSAGEAALPVVDLGVPWDGAGGGIVEDGGEDGQVPDRAVGDGDPQTAEHALEDFLGYASLPAQRLAAHLACAGPALTIPLMRLVQRSAVPESRPEHLAEVFLAGLLRPHHREPAGPQENQDRPDPHEPLAWNRRTYAYPPLVASSLRELIKRSEEQATLEGVSQYLARRQATAAAGMALISDPSGVLRADGHALPLATVKRPTAAMGSDSRIHVAVTADSEVHRLAQLLRDILAETSLREAGLEVAHRSGTVRVLFPVGRAEPLLLTTLLSRLRHALEQDEAAEADRRGPVRVAMDFAPPGEPPDSTLLGVLDSVSRHPSQDRQLWMVAASRRLMVELYGPELRGSEAFHEMRFDNGREPVYLLVEEPRPRTEPEPVTAPETAVTFRRAGDAPTLRKGDGDFAAQLALLAADLTALRVSSGNPSLRQIARATSHGTHVGEATISNALRGRSFPSDRTLLALVQALLSLSRNGVKVSLRDSEVQRWERRWTALDNLREQAGRSHGSAVPAPGKAEIMLVPAPERGIWRLARSREPLKYSYTLDDSGASGAQDRWSGPNQGTLYGASDIDGCFSEALAPFRVAPDMRDLVGEDWNTDAGFLAPGHIPRDWLTRHVLTRLLPPLEAHFLDVNDDATLQVLSHVLRPELDYLGVERLTVSDMNGSERGISQGIGAWARAQRTPTGEHCIQGITFRSRWGGHRCWGIFEGVGVRQAETQPIRPETKGLQRVAAEFGLTVH
ncbi:SAV_2336 N-terminal domain-related protein [Streptomyces sp. NPDC001502]|uniref:SAV_2336 N-terminal domain-related protein n=1 Tax=Streptomyces sp. NPDC001502 TaxID=3364578 RepID=UPI0036AC8C86